MPLLPLLAAVSALPSMSDTAVWLGVDPGRASVVKQGETTVLRNKSLEIRVDKSGYVVFKNLLPSAGSQPEQMFEPAVLTLRDGSVIKLGDLLRNAKSKTGGVKIDHKSSRSSDSIAGKEVAFTVTDPVTKLQVRWSVELRDNENFAHESLEMKPLAHNVDVADVLLLSGKSPSAAVIGTTAGSPIVDGNIFYGTEHPMSVSTAKDGSFRSEMVRKLPLTIGSTTTYDAVIGSAAAGQVRRSFLRYVEAERAHPYRPFLHYNSWYDIGYFKPYNADQCVDRINAFGQELSIKRGVKLDSFLFDDGWDDYKTVWQFNSGFPNQFQPLKAAAAKYGAGPGVWLSPWGGYGNPNKVRLATGKAAGMEIDSEGYALSGPKYYKIFHDRTMDFVQHQGINQFKLDGTGSPDKQYPGSAFSSDFDAAISLIGDLRAAKPDLFVNLTTGTWPSPFWLHTVDSIWRGGWDDTEIGVGTTRQQWITYRDGDTYTGIVQQGPLYPLNSLMLHGIIYAKQNGKLNKDPGNDFKSEVRAYFATGTGLQEMYITPDLLTKQNWDDLAETAKWARKNSDVLIDSHWIGGDPAKLEVYGHAAWKPGLGIIELRNPSDKPQSFKLDLAKALELPPSAMGSYKSVGAFNDSEAYGFLIDTGAPRQIDLAPFEVMIIEVRPNK